MKQKRLLFLFVSFSFSLTHAQDSAALRRYYDEALVNGNCYENLRYLCKSIGGRLSGSVNAQKAVDWSKKLMEGYGFDKVYLQEIMVPHWVRGAKETGYILDGTKRINVPIAALGMTVATPAQGITAEVVEVKSLAALDSLGAAGVKGKIVFFNRPFDPRFIETGRAYGTAGDQRFLGPAKAAGLGAAAVIVRSLTESIDDYPHTGATLVDKDSANIPSAAISTKAADTLSRLLHSRKSGAVKFFFRQNCKLLPDVRSYNVIGELTGSTEPNHFITVGGHLDSWDLAEGAHDDGTGVMQSIEVLRIFKATGYRPKNSIRAVLFMNEENGTRGGDKYAELAAANKEIHLAAIETDEGGFTPRGFSFSDVSQGFIDSVNRNWKSLLEPYEADALVIGGSGTDIEPIKSKVPAVVLIGFRPDSQRYFDIHHTPNDVFENVNKRELELGAAAMASLIYLIDQHGL